ncbi:DUF2972 domain-containing protein [Helicobacter sp. MIT 21-1697]|uniref:DUF2972 domain-containing protein n=1 Tax=Helicobacter sp. MIT 21-1697 TaxID=2993733 RepID=UPI00224B316F|nr:DUF2972 domain-containing protein [Helicobacter sp. MIT 21-1697]MCX2717423.1 DUF2972 domain-containing protein [Helicobacter sp. MIT 21-1697]
MKQSKTTKIYKRMGLKYAFAYQVKKKTSKIKRSKFYLTTRMFILIIKSGYAPLFYFYLRKYHILIENEASLDLITKEYNNIKLWLDSDTFKEKYANHPYPPLLNPQELDYTKITAKVAWDLNLPLPPYYLFVFFGSHASGNRGLESFLRRCGGLNYCVQSSPCNGKSWAKESYFCFFKQIMRNYDYISPPPPLYFGYLSIREYMLNDKYKDKLYALIPKGKTLCLVRDPIGMLKSYTSYHCRHSFTQVFELVLSPSEIFEQLIQYPDWYYNEKCATWDWQYSKYPTLRTSAFRLSLLDMTFHDTDLRKALINIADEDILCIDMSDIVGEKAFETMNTLAKEFHFPAPKPSDKEKFEVKAGLYEGVLPIKFAYKNIYIYLLDNAYCSDSRFYIELGQFVEHKNAFEHYQDITQFLFQQECFYERIIVCIEKKDFEILKQDTKTCEQIKTYLLTFIPRLEEQRKIEEAKRFGEKDILEYLKLHKDLCLKAKEVFDSHLTFLKSVRPDIIESWKYYQEFLRICEEIS